MSPGDAVAIIAGRLNRKPAAVAGEVSAVPSLDKLRRFAWGRAKSTLQTMIFCGHP